METKKETLERNFSPETEVDLKKQEVNKKENKGEMIDIELTDGTQIAKLNTSDLTDLDEMELEKNKERNKANFESQVSYFKGIKDVFKQPSPRRRQLGREVRNSEGSGNS